MMAGNCPIPVVNPCFCFPYPHDLYITRNIGRGRFGVKDANGNRIFKVKELLFTFRQERLILDAAGFPILTLRKKAMSMHSKWKVFRGESTNDRDLIFSARRSSIFQLKTKLHVFLAKNKSEDVCDYTIRGSWFKKSCKVYVGYSSNIVAETQKKTTESTSSIFPGKDKFRVRIHPNIDHAFIVALIVILGEISSPSK